MKHAMPTKHAKKETLCEWDFFSLV
jgi:hypothetical protein